MRRSTPPAATTLSPRHGGDTLEAQRQAMADAMERFLAGGCEPLGVRDLPYFGRIVAGHPDREEVARAAEERWLADGIDVRPYHQRAQLSHLTALCYPDAPRDRLALCHDVILFAFVCDDQIDTLPGAEELRVRRLHRECAAAIRRQRRDGFTEPLARRLVDIADRLCEQHRVDAGWYDRFSRSIVFPADALHLVGTEGEPVETEHAASRHEALARPSRRHAGGAATGHG